jgi:ribosomal protein S18 acetylase RimI-like enzyme
MTFSIRRAAIGDALSISRVRVESWKTTYRNLVPDAFLDAMDFAAGAEQWAEAIRGEQATILVAEDTDGIFGFAAGGELREAIDGYDGELYAIYLLREQQKRGAGRRLVEEIVKDLRASELTSMLVWVLAQNPAVEFYKRLGAIPVSEKRIEIGGRSLLDLALGWPDLTASF